MPLVPYEIRWAIASRALGGARAARRTGAVIGEGCRILSFRVSGEPWLVTVGDRVTITQGVHLVTHDGSGWLVRDDRGRRLRYAGIAIGDDVFIGVGSILLPGVRIGDRAIVGAGSVVTRSVPSGTIAGGSPARVIGEFDAFERRALEAWPAEQDMRGASYRERVDSVVETGWRPELPLASAPPSR
jgi:acetyltransferase-like isoleucine patch superfamily enzyme